MLRGLGRGMGKDFTPGKDVMQVQLEARRGNDESQRRESLAQLKPVRRERLGWNAVSRLYIYFRDGLAAAGARVSYRQRPQGRI